MQYIPRGYLSLSDGLTALLEVRAPALVASAEERARQQDILRFKQRTIRPAMLRGPGDLWLPSGGMAGQKLDADEITLAKQLYADDAELGRMREEAVVVLRAALAEGELSAVFIDVHGRILPITPEPWRTNAGLNGVRFGRSPLPNPWPKSPTPIALLNQGEFNAWLGEGSGDNAGGNAAGNSVADSPAEPHSPQIAPEREADGITTYSTGLPGRPTSRSLYENEFRRRVRAGENCGSLTAESEALADWLQWKHPKAAPATAKTIRENLRPIWHALLGRNSATE